jgi:7-cyano-7-deazaguanine synthase in queuosine biosynthesis
MKNIKISKTNIDIHDGTLGISLSGGADSAILLYILMKHSNDPIHVFTCSSLEKNNIAPHIAINVINKCIEITGYSGRITHHSYFVKTQTFDNWISGLIDNAMVNNVDMLYTGVTSNPPHDVISEFKNLTTLNDKRDPNVIRDLYRDVIINNKSIKIYTPWFNIDKSEISNIYNELNITDVLFPITRSCESITLLRGHCEECWWCEERKWAFGRLE